MNSKDKHNWNDIVESPIVETHDKHFDKLFSKLSNELNIEDKEQHIKSIYTILNSGHYRRLKRVIQQEGLAFIIQHGLRRRNITNNYQLIAGIVSKLV